MFTDFEVLAENVTFSLIAHHRGIGKWFGKGFCLSNSLHFESFALRNGKK